MPHGGYIFSRCLFPHPFILLFSLPTFSSSPYHETAPSMQLGNLGTVQVPTAGCRPELQLQTHFSMRSLENASDGFLLVSLCRRKCVVEAIVLYVVTCLLCEWNLVFHFKKKTSGPANSVVSLDNLTYDQRVIGKHVAHGGKEHIGLIHTKLYVVCWLRSCWLPKGMITYQYGE